MSCEQFRDSQKLFPIYPRKNWKEKKWRPKPLRSYEIRGGMTCSIMWCLSGEKFLCSCFLAAYHVRCIKILYNFQCCYIFITDPPPTPQNWIACQAEEFVGQGCWRVCASLLYSSYFICQLFVVHIYLSRSHLFRPDASYIIISIIKYPSHYFASTFDYVLICMWIVTSPSTVGTLRALTGALFLLLCVWASHLFLFFAPYIAPLFCFTHLPLYAYFRTFACQFLTVLCALPRFDSRDGTVLDTAKYHWLQGREVWTFSRLWVRVWPSIS